MPINPNPSLKSFLFLNNGFFYYIIRQYISLFKLSGSIDFDEGVIKPKEIADRIDENLKSYFNFNETYSKHRKLSILRWLSQFSDRIRPIVEDPLNI